MPIDRLTLTTTAAARRLGELIDRVIAGDRVILTRHGRPVAVLVPCADAERLIVQDLDAAGQALPERAGGTDA